MGVEVDVSGMIDLEGMVVVVDMIMCGGCRGMWSI